MKIKACSYEELLKIKKAFDSKKVYPFAFNAYFRRLFEHIVFLESILDVAEDNYAFGVKGWRTIAGLDE